MQEIQVLVDGLEVRQTLVKEVVEDLAAEAEPQITAEAVVLAADTMVVLDKVVILFLVLGDLHGDLQ